MPTLIPTSVQKAVSRSLGNYSSALGQDFTEQATQRLLDGIRSIVNPAQQDRGDGQTATVGDSPATVRAAIGELLKRFSDPQALAEELNLDFKTDTAVKVVRGARDHIQANDPDVIMIDPAAELGRLYDRDVPRGFKRGPKGTLIEVPQDDWESRWRAAAAESGDEDALNVLESTGRMVALKSSGIWQALGDGAGGYDDTLGNPYAPFAFNSGYGLTDVSRASAIELGLLDPDEKAKPAKIDFNNLFGMEEAA